MTDQIVSILFTITVALKVPVIIGLLLALVWSLYSIGIFLREWFDRKCNQLSWQQKINDFCNCEFNKRVSLSKLFSSASTPEIINYCYGYIVSQSSNINEQIQIDLLLQEIELRAVKNLSRIRIGLRLGPVLGLMGTLIPMGPALKSISQGNLEMMSNEMVIVFSTTVAGLLVGALSYLILTVRQYWYAKDLAQTEHIARFIMQRPIGVIRSATQFSTNDSTMETQACKAK